MRISAKIVASFLVLSFGMFLVLFFVSSGYVFAEEETQEEVVEEQENADPTIFQTLGEEEGKDVPSEVVTGDFSITPVVSNEKAKPRDIIKKELLITNNTQQRQDVYITVKNIDPSQGEQEFESPAVSDLSTSLANWVEITRGVIELSPGESRKIPYLIHVNLNAKPGSYFARIMFQAGSRRVEAEASNEGVSLMLNVEVVDDAKEKLQLGNFISEDGVVFGNSVAFSYLLENVGNRLIEPRGSIRIFNRRGEEVGSIPLNAEGEEITPDNKKQLAAVWSAAGRFGKYKAFLDLEYGENQLASVQDTVYFWVFPWKEIFASLMGVVVLAVVGTYIVHMRAMARPVHARRPYREENFQNEVPPEERVRQSSFPIRDTRRSSVVHAEPINHGTHLRIQGAQPTVATPVARHGATVSLGRRDRGGVQTQGNVIQLRPRN